MTGDFTRNTFDPAKHCRGVLMQQGRAQVDADWNEQADLTARRDETTTADIAGHCGGPVDSAAFGVLTTTAALSPAELQHLKDLKIPALAPGDFFLSAGRYYVDGIQCENEWAIPFTAQPDRLDVGPLTKNKSYLLYLDVWQRHITALEDGLIRESALGGPDTATRVKTICQVRVLDLGPAGVDPNNPCSSGAIAFQGLADPGTARLTADTAKLQTPKDPCLVPPSAGFTGLENQLYRVEIHDPATWKWSRENGSVVTRIEKIDGKKITVTSLGPDKNLGFSKDAWVEILDDALELEGKPGQLAQIDDVDEATRIVTLKSAASSLVPANPIQFPPKSYPNGIVPERHPKLRRWEGVVTPLQMGTPLPLESGVEVTFAAKGSYRTGHYWQIPARTATAQSPNGEIEWPVDKTNRLALAPRGITHHFCRLGTVTVKNDGSIDATDCRCLWPALTQVPRLFYVSGDGQEVMPDLVKFKDRVPLAAPLIVGVVNLHANSKVRFTITEGNGQIKGGGQTATGLQKFIDVQPTAGQASCVFLLETASHHQQVTATTLDPDCGGVPLPIIFNANLSIASEVAYDPGTCGSLVEQKTVQDALSRLAALVSLHKVSGDGQEGVTGKKLPQPLVVLAANRCGVAGGLKVQFRVVTGGGSVTPASVATTTAIPIGLATCDWTLGPNPGTQELEATLVSNDPMRPVTEPSSVRFTAFSADESNDPAPVHVVDVQLLSAKEALPNESRLSPSQLRKGIALICDQMILKDTVIDSVDVSKGVIKRGQPTCFVTAEIPYPITNSEIADIRNLEIKTESFIGYRPVVLHAGVMAEQIDDEVKPGIGKPVSQIVWLPDPMALTFLEKVLGRLKDVNPHPDAILLRLTLKGNFIWSETARELFENGTPGGYLDGDTFRFPKELRIILPSGDNRRGGDFEMWFWLELEAK